ncbi:putative manganese-dependent inorganic diphosphatase [Aminipila terrae]|uniref:inorganic diphosphatase n=1 Tax=Aminipila terrae TaxID=2697030 RepID=A0A6P1MKG5_9FIRM|nr:putative manganese-dependent inorganic diphosphatase [Aminipila terrae]QHI72528.1 putative manganese-dependent inorganic diphosphatase [Aminipila terrae]
MDKQVYVIGHKNPDTDSICSAIAYANLKNQISDKCYEAKRAGQVNNETKYVLEKFEVETPELIDDVGTQIRDVAIKKIDGIESGISLKKAWNMMKDTSNSTLPVTSDGKLEGIISVNDIATANMDIYETGILALSKTPYRNILDTLEGTMVVGDEEGYVEDGKILIGAANPDLMENYIEKNDILITGNRFESHLCAIEMNAGCIVVCMGAPVSKTIKKLAMQNNCRIISTPYETYVAARLINQSTPIRYFMRKENIVTFEEDDYISDMKETVTKIRYRDFPVLDTNGNYCGMLSRRSLINMNRKKIILVDHNEKSQAVDGIEEAEIMEIIDHHRIGNLETLAPVYFRNQPLGCTATIIYQMYLELGVELDKKIAGLLCSAILSDTLMFRSPTCTDLDKAAAEKLAQIAEVNIEEHAEKMFRAGSSLQDKSTEEIFYQDYKKFASNGIKFGAGQITSMDGEELAALKPKILPFMENACKSSSADMLFFMLTDVIHESTELLFVGEDARNIVERAFGVKPEESSIVMKNIVSRKKQVIPQLINAMQG